MNDADEFRSEMSLQIRNLTLTPVVPPPGSPRPDVETYDLILHTSRGDIIALLDVCEGQTGAVVYCGGAKGGPSAVRGPANGVYEQLSGVLGRKGITSLRIHYRKPGNFEESVMDVLAACSFLQGVGAKRIVVVGHSFGGAVVIKAGQLTPMVVAVVALAPQGYGTRQVDQLNKPLLIVHGTSDSVLSPAIAEDIHRRANGPKWLVLLEGTSHSLQESAVQVFDELEPFLLQHAGPEATS